MNSLQEDIDYINTTYLKPKGLLITATYWTNCNLINFTLRELENNRTIERTDFTSMEVSTRSHIHWIGKVLRKSNNYLFDLDLKELLEDTKESL